MNSVFVLQRDGTDSRSKVYRNADGQLCVWDTEEDAELHAAKIASPHYRWRVRTSVAADFVPPRRLAAYRPAYVNLSRRAEVQKKTESSKLLVELFEDYEARKFAISSSADNEIEFIDEVSQAIGNHFSGDWRLRMRELLPLIVDICCKYRGYKAEHVTEKRLLVAGDLEMPKVGK